MDKLSNEALGFVIVRHVNNELTDKYWKEAYRCIRKFYDNPIMIVDDNSNTKFLKEDIELINCQTINGEFPGSGEVLGYYYFHKLHPFEKAVIIHDAVFIKKKLDFSNMGEIQFLWEFEHNWDNDKDIIMLISQFDNCGELIRLYYDKSRWNGCFGIMSVLTWNIIDKINKRYNFFDVSVRNINTRPDRMLLERVFAVTCHAISPDLEIKRSMFGIIHNYCKWGRTFADYLNNRVEDRPIIKVWTER